MQFNGMEIYVNNCVLLAIINSRVTKIFQQSSKSDKLFRVEEGRRTYMLPNLQRSRTRRTFLYERPLLMSTS